MCGGREGQWAESNVAGSNGRGAMGGEAMGGEAIDQSTNAYKFQTQEKSSQLGMRSVGQLR